ncbi:MAG: SDR family oxidoreductase [Alphaproteobacteria bacterium]|nr:SDR family oxidoreductase [Alphaproteobacteria bacterium]
MRKVLILGATGMIGNGLFRALVPGGDLDVCGTVRAPSDRSLFDSAEAERLIPGVFAEDWDGLSRLLAERRPDVVINAIGIVKQLDAAKDSLKVLSLNSLFPHKLALLCRLAGSRLIQISTDCVFSGKDGRYRETDSADATDLYGRAKFLGEIDYPNTVTLRTSTIGSELRSGHGLMEWFLSQEGTVRGFTKALYSGVPTIELGRVIREHVLPNETLQGLYHVSSKPISKYDLLCLVKEACGKAVDIVPDDTVCVDRSLDGGKFKAATGYEAASWPDLVKLMVPELKRAMAPDGG